MAERLGLRAAAAKLGISHVGLKKASDSGRVTRGDDGLFDVDQCREQLAANSHPGKQKSGRAQQKPTEPSEPKIQLSDKTVQLKIVAPSKSTAAKRYPDGTRVLITGDHPYTGRSGVIRGYEILGLLPELGPQPKITLDDGQECFADTAQVQPVATTQSNCSPNSTSQKDTDDLGEYDDEAPTVGMDYNRLLCERERIKIEDARLNLRVKRGELVPLAEINAYISDEKIRAREILTRLGPELRDRLAQTVDPIECERLVMAQVTRALNEMSEYKLPE